MRSGLVVLLGLLISNHADAQTLDGRLAFIRDGAAWVMDLKSGKLTRLASSDRAVRVSLSPTSAFAVYEVDAMSATDTMEYRRGYCSPAPYAHSEELPWPFDFGMPFATRWSYDGRRAFLSGENDAELDTATRQLVPLTCRADSASRHGALVTYVSGHEIRLRDLATGDDRLLFSCLRPAALWQALRLKGMTGEDQPPLSPTLSDWQLGEPALTPDGRTAYYAANAGSGFDSLGNTYSCLVACDTRSRALGVVAAVGWFRDAIRAYDIDYRLCLFEPNKRRLLVTSMCTSLCPSGACRQCFAQVVDLASGASRELLWSGKDLGSWGSLVDGACWSPDGRFAAVSAAFGRFTKDAREDPQDAASFDVCIYDAATGRMAKRLPGASSPSWSAPAR